MIKTDKTSTEPEDDDFGKEVKQPAIKSLTEAMEVGEKLLTLHSFMDTRNLALSCAKSNDIIYALKLCDPQ